MTVFSLYIPHFEKIFDPNFIAMTLDKKGIAKVRRIAIESYPKKHPLHSRFQRAYVDIYGWHDTESAYYFIQRLLKPNLETRLNHSDDNWWIVHINKFPNKTLPHKNRILTVYQLPDSESDDETYISDYQPDDSDDMSGLTNEEQGTHDFDNYMREIHDRIIDQQLDYAEYLADF